MQVSEFYTSNKQAMPFIVLLCDDVLVEVLLFATRHQLAGIEVCGYRFHRFIDGNQNTGGQGYNVGIFVEKPLLLFDLRFERWRNVKDFSKILKSPDLEYRSMTGSVCISFVN